jgi:hypothetical protein
MVEGNYSTRDAVDRAAASLPTTRSQWAPSEVGNRSVKPTTRRGLTSPGVNSQPKGPQRSLIIFSAHQLTTDCDTRTV